MDTGKPTGKEVFNDDEEEIEEITPI